MSNDGENVDKGKAYTLLVGMGNTPGTMKINVEASQKNKNRSTM